ncbi:hypothetical protein [Streptomyces aidingensis]|uniref:Peptidase inhibitor family I36 n=1 Tax=Streptomyces aidingensis TaxID=910347 RepID=A0A1I1TYD8_9ACTN|nr:hypothetical protein [Streptomyces aidingensis]SFD62318.1 hypothetical protein SAMN05421773_12145 [Streptomyces aidingensis]
MPFKLRSLLTAAAACALVIGTTTSAEASAVGYEKVSGFCFTMSGQTVCAPTATLGHYIKGDGRKIERQEASIQDVFGADTAGREWCNWRFDWRYADTNGKTYLIRKGKTHNGCSFWSSIGRVDNTTHTLKHYGKACAAFYASGKERAVQCHNITK